MLKSNYKTKVRFNREIHGRKVGAEELVKCTKDGVLLDPLLRRRIKDNDNSLVILGKNKPKEVKKPEKADNKPLSDKSDKRNIDNK